MRKITVDPETGREELTPREKEVLKLLACGYTDREIASLLSISLFTAKTHVSHILGKLQFTSRTRAAVYAFAVGGRKEKLPCLVGPLEKV